MKTKRLSNYEPLKGLILERKYYLGYSDTALGRTIGVSRQTMSKMLSKSINEWKTGDLIAICRELRVLPSEFHAAYDYK